MSVETHNLATPPAATAPATAWSTTETRTVIELGSGMGSSAVWMADILKAFNIDSHIYSVDLNKPGLHYDGITFIRGDCLKIETVFPSGLLQTAAHPWLFIRI